MGGAASLGMATRFPSLYPLIVDLLPLQSTSPSVAETMTEACRLNPDVYGANVAELIVHSFWIQTIFGVFVLLQNSSLH